MRPVYREHPVKMVDLMLQQFRAVALKLGLMRLAPQVVVSDANAVGSEDAHQQVGVREAIVPDRKVFVPDVHDLRIDEHPGLVHLDVRETERRADLRRCNAATGAEAGLPVAEGIREVVHDDTNRRRLGVGDRFAALPEDGIAEQADSTDGHGAKVGPVVPTVNYPRLEHTDRSMAKSLSHKVMRDFVRLGSVPTVLLVAGMAACSDGTGGSTPTSNITPDFSISATPNSVTFVLGQLKADQFASVRLPDNDALNVSAAGQEKLMRWTPDARGGGYYSASLTQLDPGTAITVALTRGDGGNAPNSLVTMPEPIDVTAPVSGALATAGANLAVTWTPSGTPDEIRILLRTVLCSRPGAGTTQTATVVGDPGSATVLIDPDLLPPLNPGEQCDVDVQVQRVRYGTVDPAYAAGGTIQARQLATVTIVVAQR
jgi:hypothetical protein